ncbi:hypothetical protein SLEP1_g33028 [Rubroshorea leprosula]|uniref:NADH dehydrogenase subunit 4 n=1 Tax=Rubroshorea leprosula TaxID=152421 RepID=A0AAV5KFC3_9ROSI|nr:hypothetical protein SLEP1_g33028 [Rubroshorea leprosula]
MLFFFFWILSSIACHFLGSGLHILFCGAAYTFFSSGWFMPAVFHGGHMISCILTPPGHLCGILP